VTGCLGLHFNVTVPRSVLARRQHPCESPGTTQYTTNRFIPGVCVSPAPHHEGDEADELPAAALGKVEVAVSTDTGPHSPIPGCGMRIYRLAAPKHCCGTYPIAQKCDLPKRMRTPWHVLEEWATHHPPSFAPHCSLPAIWFPSLVNYSAVPPFFEATHSFPLGGLGHVWRAAFPFRLHNRPRMSDIEPWFTAERRLKVARVAEPDASRSASPTPALLHPCHVGVDLRFGSKFGSPGTGYLGRTPSLVHLEDPHPSVSTQ
jgi:hypothetical protein